MPDVDLSQYGTVAAPPVDLSQYGTVAGDQGSKPNPVQDQLEGFGRSLKTQGKGLFDILTSLVDPVLAEKMGSGAVDAQVDQWHKAKDEYAKGNYANAARRGLAAAVPLIGPLIENSAEKMTSGRPGAITEGVTDVALGPALAHGIEALPEGTIPRAVTSTVEAAKKTGPVLSAAAKAGGKDVLVGSGKLAAGAALAKAGPLGEIGDVIAGVPIVKSGLKQIGAGVRSGYAAGKQALADSNAAPKETPVAAPPSPAEPSPELLDQIAGSLSKGKTYDKLQPSMQTVVRKIALSDMAKRAAQAAASAPAQKPVAPEQGTPPTGSEPPALTTDENALDRDAFLRAADARRGTGAAEAAPAAAPPEPAPVAPAVNSDIGTKSTPEVPQVTPPPAETAGASALPEAAIPPAAAPPMEALPAVKPNVSPAEGERSGANIISRLTSGQPGVAMESEPGRLRRIVYRDANGHPKGYLQFYLDDEQKGIAPPDHGLYPEVFADPSVRRTGVATSLYDAAAKQGFDLSKVSGTETTPSGAAFLNARRAAASINAQAPTADLSKTPAPANFGEPTKPVAPELPILPGHERIKSSMAHSVGIDPVSGDPQIFYGPSKANSGGTLYRFVDDPKSGLPPVADEFRKALQAESFGAYFQRHIRPKYKGIRIEIPQAPGLLAGADYNPVRTPAAAPAPAESAPATATPAPQPITPQNAPVIPPSGLNEVKGPHDMPLVTDIIKQNTAPPEVAAKSPEAGTVAQIPTSQIHADPVRFQFKHNVGVGGVTGELRGLSKFDPEKSGILSVWQDPADGKTYVVNGHNRLDLAQQKGEPSVTARYLDAKDATEARTKGALINIAEGRGDAIDAAKVFRDSGMDAAALEREGVSLKGEKARTGLALANLDPHLFNQVLTGDLPVERAAIIGEGVTSPEDQRALSDLLTEREKAGKRLTNDQVGEMIRLTNEAPKLTETQENLFGAQEMTRSLMPEKADVSNFVRQHMAQEGRLFQAVATGNAADKLATAGNVIKAGENAKVATTTAQARALYDKLSTSAGPVNDALDAAAQAIAKGENANAAKSAAYERIKAHLFDQARNLAGEGGPSGERPQGNGTGGTGGPSARQHGNHKVGDTVKVRGVGQVTIKKIDGDGTFEY